MKYNQPYGVADPNAPYVNGDPSTGTMGSIPPAASIEYPQREIVNMVSLSNIAPSNSDLQQLARAVQSGKINYALDSGPTNALVANLNPAVLAYTDALAVWVIPQFSNTGAATLNLNGLGARNIVRRGGAPLSAGDMPAGFKSLLTYNVINNNFELYGTGFTVGGFLPILQANTIWYVNGTTGSDTLYDGTAPTISGPHGPFATIGKAMSVVFTYGPSIYTATIQVAAGTYNENVATPQIVGPTTIINGAGKTSTHIVGSGTASVHTILAQNANSLTVQNCRIGTSGGGSGQSAVVSTTNAIITVKDIALSAAPVGYLLDALGGQLIAGNVDFNAGANALAAFVSFTAGSLIMAGNAVYNILGSVTYSAAFATASGLSVISSAPAGLGAPTFTGAGFVTGQKFATALNGVINTQGQSVSWLPGSAVGVNNSGGQYG
jgi:hypothetical protein